MPFLCRFSHKETCASLILIPFSLVLKNAVSKTRTADNVYYFSLKSDDAMFLPVGKSDVAFGAICAFDTFRIYICHSERKYKGPQKILLYFWGKGAHKHKSERYRLR